MIKKLGAAGPPPRIRLPRSIGSERRESKSGVKGERGAMQKGKAAPLGEPVRSEKKIAHRKRKTE